MLIPWLPAVVVGLLIFTAGFFGAHSVANGWVPARATVGRAQASSLYTLFYYGGSSVFGHVAGLFLTSFGWNGAVAFIGALIAVAIALTVLFLRRPVTPGTVWSREG